MILDTITDMVSTFGYLGIFIATSLEYGCFPISSEVLLPFIGYFVFKGNMNLMLAVTASTIGGIFGSFFCYCLGRFGKNFCNKFPAIKKGIDRADNVFNKYGRQSVLIARVFPIARTYISVPAGLAGMNAAVFVLYTSIGAFIWNVFLISIGYFLGEYWQNAGTFISENHILFYIVTALLSIILIKLSNRKMK